MNFRLPFLPKSIDPQLVHWATPVLLLIAGVLTKPLIELLQMGAKDGSLFKVFFTNIDSAAISNAFITLFGITLVLVIFGARIAEDFAKALKAPLEKIVEGAVPSFSRALASLAPNPADAAKAQAFALFSTSSVDADMKLDLVKDGLAVSTGTAEQETRSYFDYLVDKFALPFVEPGYVRRNHKIETKCLGVEQLGGRKYYRVFEKASFEIVPLRDGAMSTIGLSIGLPKHTGTVADIMRQIECEAKVDGEQFFNLTPGLKSKIIQQLESGKLPFKEDFVRIDEQEDSYFLFRFERDKKTDGKPLLVEFVSQELQAADDHIVLRSIQTPTLGLSASYDYDVHCQIESFTLAHHLVGAPGARAQRWVNEYDQKTRRTIHISTNEWVLPGICYFLHLAEAERASPEARA